MNRSSKTPIINRSEIDFSAIRAHGAGGQNVNKVSSAVHLRFDIHASSLPEVVKIRLLKCGDHRINKEGLVVIKAQEFRTQEKNKIAAIERLNTLVQKAMRVSRQRKPTRPHAAARAKRMDLKTHRGRIKSLRAKVIER